MKLRDFLTSSRFPDGFPIQLTIPVFPTITADVTFAECNIGSEQMEPDMFEVPQYFRYVPTHLFTPDAPEVS